MDKKTQMWIGVAAIAGVAYWLWNKNTSKKEKVFANLRGGSTNKRKDPPACVVYDSSCNAAVGTIITEWVGGGAGIIVANSSTRCIVCPKSDTPTGMPREW
jgi:hypothetical protein